METTQLIAQITLIIFIVILFIKTIKNRKAEFSSFHFWGKITAIFILSIWLFFAGSFDKII